MYKIYSSILKNKADLEIFKIPSFSEWVLIQSICTQQTNKVNLFILLTLCNTIKLLILYNGSCKMMQLLSETFLQQHIIRAF